MIFSQNINFFIVLFNKASYPESSDYSSELEVIIPGKEPGKWQSKENQ
jgi:hypothetical protein